METAFVVGATAAVVSRYASNRTAEGITRRGQAADFIAVANTKPKPGVYIG